MTGCRLLRCGLPATWTIHYTHSSPDDETLFTAVYCDQHAGDRLANPTVTRAERLPQDTKGPTAARQQIDAIIAEDHRHIDTAQQSDLAYRAGIANEIATGGIW